MTNKMTEKLTQVTNENQINHQQHSVQTMLTAIDNMNASTRKVEDILSKVNNQITYHHQTILQSNKIEINLQPNSELSHSQIYQIVNRLRKRILGMSELIMQTKNDIRMEEVNRIRLMKVLYELKLKKNENKAQQATSQQQTQQQQYSVDNITVQKVKSVTRLSNGARKQRQSNKHFLSPAY